MALLPFQKMREYRKKKGLLSSYWNIENNGSSLKCLTANFSTSFNLTYIGSPPPTSKPLKPLVIWTPLNGDTPQYVYSNRTKFDWSKIFALFCISARGGTPQNQSKSDLIIPPSIHIGQNIILDSETNPPTPPPQYVYSNRTICSPSLFGVGGSEGWSLNPK